MVYLIKTDKGIEACEKSLKGKSIWYRQLFNGFFIEPVTAAKKVVTVNENTFFNSKKTIEELYDNRIRKP